MHINQCTPYIKWWGKGKQPLLYTWVEKNQLKSSLACPVFLFPCCFRFCVSCFPFHCQRAYITVALPSQRAAEKTIGRCLESIASKFIGARLCSSCPLCVSQSSLLTVPTEAPEKMYINMRVFGDVTWLQSIKKTKDTCKNDCCRLQGMMRTLEWLQHITMSVQATQ